MELTVDELCKLGSHVLTVDELCKLGSHVLEWRTNHQRVMPDGDSLRWVDSWTVIIPMSWELVGGRRT